MSVYLSKIGGDSGSCISNNSYNAYILNGYRPDLRWIWFENWILAWGWLLLFCYWFYLVFLVSYVAYRGFYPLFCIILFIKLSVNSLLLDLFKSISDATTIDRSVLHSETRGAVFCLILSLLGTKCILCNVSFRLGGVDTLFVRVGGF